eukprot:gene28054-31155_t
MIVYSDRNPTSAVIEAGAGASGDTPVGPGEGDQLGELTSWDWSSFQHGQLSSIEQLAPMDAFFEKPLQYHPNEATVSIVATTDTWPPRIAAAGHAPTLRGWTPQGNKTNVKFNPEEALREVDGYRQVAMDIKGDVLASADSSPSGNISIWDVSSGEWKRKQTLQAGAAVASLALSDDFLAVGTMRGSVRIWCRPKPGLVEYAKLFDNDFQINAGHGPCKTVLLGQAPDATPLLVVHSAEKNRLGVWKLNDGKLVHSLGRPIDPTDIETSVVETNVAQAILCETIMAMISWAAGSDPVIQLVDVLSRQGNVVEAPERLVGRGQPLCADFNGSVLLAGFEDGALAAFGVSGWLRFHAGAVGAVKIVGQGSQAVSGSTDKTVRLWSLDGGAQLAKFDIGFQVTALSAGDVFAVVGGNRGEVQLVVLAPEGGKQGVDKELEQFDEAPKKKPTEYAIYFDSRPDADCLKQGGGAQGASTDHQAAFDSFVPSISPISAETLLSHAAEAAKEGGEGSDKGGSGKGGKGSGFNSNAALKGAKATAREQKSETELAGEAKQKQELAEEAKQKQLKQMGESGVARASHVELESSSARVGRKCDNGNCLVREGLGVTQFKRCGACRLVFYCSAHCQRTHWRDEHSKQCATLKEEGAAKQKQATDVTTAKATEQTQKVAATEQVRSCEKVAGGGRSCEKVAGEKAAEEEQTRKVAATEQVRRWQKVAGGGRSCEKVAGEKAAEEEQDTEGGSNRAAGNVPEKGGGAAEDTEKVESTASSEGKASGEEATKELAPVESAKDRVKEVEKKAKHVEVVSYAIEPVKAAVGAASGGDIVTGADTGTGVDVATDGHVATGVISATGVHVGTGMDAATRGQLEATFDDLLGMD